MILDAAARICDLKREIARLKAESERLKEENNRYRDKLEILQIELVTFFQDVTIEQYRKTFCANVMAEQIGELLKGDRKDAEIDRLKAELESALKPTREVAAEIAELQETLDNKHKGVRKEISDEIQN